MNRSGSIGLAGVALLAAATTAAAATLTFDYTSGSCVQNCEDIGLAEGTPATGRVVIRDNGYSAGDFFGPEALVDFEISVGDFHLDLASAPYGGFAGTWAFDDVPIIFYLTASASDTWLNPGNTIFLNGDPSWAFGTVSRSGVCEPDIDFPDSGCLFGYQSAAFVELSEAEPIPLPAGAWLLISAIFGAVGLHRVAGARRTAAAR